MAKPDDTIIIHNSNGDFHQIQNYVIQLVSEKRLTASAYLLYGFYQSLNGFSFIRVGYRYISENTGISTGNIKRLNEMLVECGLITLKDNGYKRAPNIDITPNHLIPRRILKTVSEAASCSDDEVCATIEQPVQPLNTKSAPCSTNEHIHRLQQDRINTEMTTTPLRKNSRKKSELDTKKQVKSKEIYYTNEEHDFIKTFISKWKAHSKSKYYTKTDFSEIKKLKDLSDALKYIDVLWCLDEVDKWVRESDHTLTVFVKEYLSGKVQDMFPKTIYAVETIPA